MWDRIAGQDRVISQLRRATRSMRVSHAYLFMGAVNTATKEAAAKTFATALLCSSDTNSKGGGEDKPCGICRNCMKVEQSAHSDLIEIRPASSSMRIAQMRELINRASLSPVEADRKVYILYNVEMLTLDAANSLLKLLEDPPGHSVFILLADTSEVLSTIVSRCQVLRFGTDAALETEVDNDHTAFAAQWLLLSVEQRLQQSAILAKGKHDLLDFIDALTWWVRDAYLYQSGLIEGVDATANRRDIIHAVSLRYLHQDLRDKWQLLLGCRRLMDRNVNKRALTDYVLWVLLDGVN